MKEPPHFPAQPPVRISKEDKTKLAPVLNNWNQLHEYLTLTTPGAIELKKLILLEHTGGNRQRILHRLIGRLFSVERAALYLSIGVKDPATKRAKTKG